MALIIVVEADKSRQNYTGIRIGAKIVLRYFGEAVDSVVCLIIITFWDNITQADTTLFYEVDQSWLVHTFAV